MIAALTPGESWTLLGALLLLSVPLAIVGLRLIERLQGRADEWRRLRACCPSCDERWDGRQCESCGFARRGAVIGRNMEGQEVRR